MSDSETKAELIEALYCIASRLEDINNNLTALQKNGLKVFHPK